MKSVLISIQPKWCELIASGKKTVEVRKTKPKLDVPFKCYIYCTMPKNKHDNLVLTPFGYDVGSEAAYCNYAGNSNGKVIGEFVCDKIDYWQYNWKSDVMHIQDMSDLSCVSVDDLLKYANYEKDTLYGWHIYDLVIYDKPRELWEFKTICKEYGSDNPKCTDCDYYIRGCYEYEESDCGCRGRKPIVRPPQSWCYVEDTNGKI